MEGERDVVESVRLDDAWTLVEEFAGLVRDSGSEDELRALERITTRLDAWQIPYQVHRPELLISLPRRAGLTVDGRTYSAKTPSMARSTRAGGETAPVIYQASEFARSVHDIFAGAATGGDVAGSFVLTEGLHAWMALLTFSRPPVTVRPDNEGIGSTLLSKLFFRPAVSREQADNTSAAAPETWGVAIDVPLKKE